MPAPTFSTSALMRHAPDRFSAEISSLSEGGRRQVFGQVFQDACDEGLTLVSHWTGKRIRMYVEHTYKDSDGDMTHWELKSYGPDLHGVPSISLTIFND